MSPDGLNLAGAFNPADSRSPGERDSSAVFNRGIAVPPPGDPATFPALAAEIRALAAQLTAPVWFAWSKGDAVIPLARCRPAIAAISADPSPSAAARAPARAASAHLS